MTFNLSSGVASRLQAITPSDTATVGCQALYIGSAGNLTILADGDSAPVTLVGVAAGTILPIATSKVLASTTAGSIVAFYI